jgi:hypothetical protein
MLIAKFKGNGSPRMSSLEARHPERREGSPESEDLYSVQGNVTDIFCKSRTFNRDNSTRLIGQNTP